MIITHEDWQVSDERVDHEPVVTLRVSPFQPIQYFQAIEDEIWVLDANFRTVTRWRHKLYSLIGSAA